MSEEEMGELIRQVPPEVCRYIITDAVISHEDLYPDDHGMLDLQKDVDYYRPTAEELLELGRFGYLPNRPEAKALSAFFADNLCLQSDGRSMLHSDADYVVMWLQKLAASGCSAQRLLEYLSEFGIQIPLGNRRMEVESRLMEFQENCPMMAYRGHTFRQINTV